MILLLILNCKNKKLENLFYLYSQLFNQVRFIDFKNYLKINCRNIFSFLTSIFCLPRRMNYFSFFFFSLSHKRAIREKNLLYFLLINILSHALCDPPPSISPTYNSMQSLLSFPLLYISPSSTKDIQQRYMNVIIQIHNFAFESLV